MQRAYYAVMRWFVAGIYRTVVKLARVEVSFSESDAAERILSSPGRPVIVLSRHVRDGGLERSPRSDALEVPSLEDLRVQDTEGGNGAERLDLSRFRVEHLVEAPPDAHPLHDAGTIRDHALDHRQQRADRCVPEPGATSSVA